VIHTVRDCVDLKDNMILELALSGGADIIISGDDHLLRLHPWRGIRILKPADYHTLKPTDGLRVP
jgi:predicted nucleic acid-binding protein